MRSRLLLFILTLPLSLAGQSLSGYADAANMDYIMRNAPIEMRNLKGDAYGTIGTPNYFEEFRNGNIYLANKTVFKNIPINYDCFNERVLYHKGEAEYILNNKLIDYLEFPGEGDNTIVFKQVFVLEKKKTLFMKLVYQGESTLYKYYYKSFKEADYTGAYNQDRRYNEYVDNHAWYIESGGEELVRFRPKKNSILQHMESHRKEMEEFLKKEKLDLKTEEGLKSLVQYFDQLLTEEGK